MPENLNLEGHEVIAEEAAKRASHPIEQMTDAFDDALVEGLAIAGELIAIDEIAKGYKHPRRNVPEPVAEVPAMPLDRFAQAQGRLTRTASPAWSMGCGSRPRRTGSANRPPGPVGAVGAVIGDGEPFPPLVFTDQVDVPAARVFEGLGGESQVKDGPA